MNDTFLKHALPFVLASEGGYSDDKNDSGGATMHGITHTEYDAWRRAHGEPVQDVRKISDEEVHDIYKQKYWDPIHGDELPYPIDEITFDAAVNMGVTTAIRMLELADGDHGGPLTPELLAKIKADCATVDGTHKLKEGELQVRIQRYHAIVAAHPKDHVFLHGWLNRVAALGEES